MIVFLHGAFGNKCDWDQVIRELSIPCVAFNLPGHGKAPIDFDLYGEMNQLPPFHLVGYSMGGRIAREYPGKTLSLTLISTHPGLKTEAEKQARMISDEQLAKDILSMPIDAFLKRWYDQPLFESLRAKLDICQMRKDQNQEGLAAAIRRYSLGAYPVTEKKAHIILGEQDKKYRDLYASVPHAVVPNAGHAIHLENPVQLAKEIYDHVLSV